ncbi:hypothetical protein C0J52_16155 [Blattella germanica]|nr:hypothetical protein C0J52_16155 [Blattella germanica]
MQYVKPERKPAVSKFASMPLNAKHTLIPNKESFAPENFKFKGPATKPVLGLSIANRSKLPTSKTNSKYIEQKHDVPVARRVTKSQTRSTNKELLHVTKPMPSRNQEKKTKAKNVSAMAPLSFTAMETVTEKEIVKETPQKSEFKDIACGDTPKNHGESTLLEDNNSDKENVIHVENHSPEKIIAQAKTPLCTP